MYWVHPRLPLPNQQYCRALHFADYVMRCMQIDSLNICDVIIKPEFLPSNTTSERHKLPPACNSGAGVPQAKWEAVWRTLWLVLTYLFIYFLMLQAKITATYLLSNAVLERWLIKRLTCSQSQKDALLYHFKKLNILAIRFQCTVTTCWPLPQQFFGCGVPSFKCNGNL